MMRFQGLIFVLIFVVLAPVDAAETVPIAEVGATTLRAQAGKRSVEASVITEKRRAALREDEDDSTAPERSVVRAIIIKMNGQKIPVPGSVFCDLVLPNRAELGIGPGISVLTIRGGDASASYIVRIEFDSDRVKRTTFASSLIPDKPLQITTFYERTLEDRPLKKR
jgi:hypothetical protein